MTPSEAQTLLDTIPYAKTLGIVAREIDGEVLLCLPHSDSNIGNPVLPALHGGAVGGFVEVCAMAELKRRHPDRPFAKAIGINIDYLRRGKPQDTYARADLFKEGSRVTNVRVRAWQESEDKPIVALSGHFLLAKHED